MERSSIIVRRSMDWILKAAASVAKRPPASQRGRRRHVDTWHCADNDPYWCMVDDWRVRKYDSGQLAALNKMQRCLNFTFKQLIGILLLGLYRDLRTTISGYTFETNAANIAHTRIDEYSSTGNCWKLRNANICYVRLFYEYYYSALLSHLTRCRTSLATCRCME